MQAHTHKHTSTWVCTRADLGPSPFPCTHRDRHPINLAFHVFDHVFEFRALSGCMWHCSPVASPPSLSRL